MDSEELDAWYDEQKEILFDNFINGKDSDKNAEDNYKKKMQKLRLKYEKLVDRLNKKTVNQNQLSQNIFSKLINRFKR